MNHLYECTITIYVVAPNAIEAKIIASRNADNEALIDWQTAVVKNKKDILWNWYNETPYIASNISRMLESLTCAEIVTKLELP